MDIPKPCSLSLSLSIYALDSNQRIPKILPKMEQPITNAYIHNPMSDHLQLYCDLKLNLKETTLHLVSPLRNLYVGASASALRHHPGGTVSPNLRPNQVRPPGLTPVFSQVAASGCSKRSNPDVGHSTVPQGLENKQTQRCLCKATTGFCAPLDHLGLRKHKPTQNNQTNLFLEIFQALCRYTVHM